MFTSPMMPQLIWCECEVSISLEVAMNCDAGDMTRALLELSNNTTGPPFVPVKTCFMSGNLLKLFNQSIHSFILSVCYHKGLLTPSNLLAHQHVAVASHVSSIGQETQIWSWWFQPKAWKLADHIFSRRSCCLLRSI